jgi:glycosyltransferase involved in cell wall biosynthesis
VAQRKIFGDSMISVILPNHNESRIHEVVEEIEKVLGNVEIIIASDREGRGKGWAVREAFTYSNGDVIIFLDGDMDIHPRMIKRVLAHLDEFDIVVGKKDTKKNLYRWFITILSRIYIRAMFGIPVDTQTGIKAFRRYALLGWETDGFAFDIEILARAKRSGFSMYEVTVEANVSRNIKLRSILNCLIESFNIIHYMRRSK